MVILTKCFWRLFKIIYILLFIIIFILELSARPLSRLLVIYLFGFYFILIYMPVSNNIVEFFL